MQENNFLEDSFWPSNYGIRYFIWVFITDETSWEPSNVTYPTISTTSQTMKEYADPVFSRSTQTLSISNEAI